MIKRKDSRLTVASLCKPTEIAGCSFTVSSEPSALCSALTASEEGEVRSVEEELHAAMDDPTLQEEDLQELLRRAEKDGMEIDPGLRADGEFRAQRLARFWGEGRD